MTPTKYTLELDNGYFKLKAHFIETLKPSIIECVQNITGKSLTGLRKTGQKQAKRFGVEFVDLTAN